MNCNIVYLLLYRFEKSSRQKIHALLWLSRWRFFFRGRRGGGGDHELGLCKLNWPVEPQIAHGDRVSRNEKAKCHSVENVVKSQTLIAVSRSNFNRGPFLDLQPTDERLELLGLVTDFSVTPTLPFSSNTFMRAPSICRCFYLCKSLESSKCWQASSASVLAGPWYLTFSKLCVNRERLRHKSVKNGRLEGFSSCSWKHKATLKGNGYRHHWLSRLSEVQLELSVSVLLVHRNPIPNLCISFRWFPVKGRQVCQVFIAHNTTSHPDSRLPHLSSLSCWLLLTILHVHILSFPNVRWHPIPHLCTLSYRPPFAISLGYMYLFRVVIQ